MATSAVCERDPVPKKHEIVVQFAVRAIVEMPMKRVTSIVGAMLEVGQIGPTEQAKAQIRFLEYHPIFAEGVHVADSKIEVVGVTDMASWNFLER